jgi:TM2 domain-containing membrane protein YozV
MLKQVQHDNSLKKIFLLLFLFFSISQSQTLNELHSPENIRKFADYLFNEKDYLRSITEYERLLEFKLNDTVLFKIALAYQSMEKYEIALEKFSEIKAESLFYEESEKEYFKILFQSGKYEELQNSIVNKDGKDFQRLLYLSYLFTSDNLPYQQNFLEFFSLTEQENILNFYNQKKDPPYKNPLLSGVISAIIPGSGKIYLGEVGDGIVAFLATSVFTFLSYDNFSNDHNFRGWLFAGLGFFFYAGNIYGSVAAAQIYNARIDYEYNANLKEYLQNKNYFLPENAFIK